MIFRHPDAESHAAVPASSNCCASAAGSDNELRILPRMAWSYCGEGLAGVFIRLTHDVELLRGVEGIIGFAVFHQLFGILAVKGLTLALRSGTVRAAVNGGFRRAATRTRQGIPII